MQRLEHEDLATGKKGSDDLERRVLRGGADQDHRAVFHRSQERILLGFVEPVDLVDKEDRGAFAGKQGSAFGLVYDIPDILYTGRNRGQLIEIALQRLGDDMGERGLSHPGRSPENEGRQVPALDHGPENAARSDQMPLSHVSVQIRRPHPLGKGRKHRASGCRVVRKGHCKCFNCAKIAFFGAFFKSLFFFFRIICIFETVIK